MDTRKARAGKDAPRGSGPSFGTPAARVGHIRILETLGTGGMGDVYVGWDEALERRVALKAIRKRHRMRPEVKARFLREARVLSQLDHPNICRIYDYVGGKDRDYLVLELVEGETLARVLRRRKKDAENLDETRRLEIAEQVAKALAAAHAKGVVHRDLKPQNVMLAEAGSVKVLDFGIARSVETSKPAAPPPAFQASADQPQSEAEAEANEAGGTPLDATELALPVGLEAAPRAGLHEDPLAEQTLALPGGPAPGKVPGMSRPAPQLLRQKSLAPEPAEQPAGQPAGQPTEEPIFDSKSEPTGSFTREGLVLGSPGYLSPEQAQGETLTTASDLYSFGLLLQELFTGERPYPEGASVAELVERAQRGERLPLRGVRSDVGHLIDRLLDPAPAARPTAVEALARLRWIRDTPRRRLVRGAIAAAILLLLLFGLKYTLDLKAARDEARLHRAQAEDLIGFMLGDLRDKLSEVGRLELLEDVGDQALTYFETIPLANRTDEEVFRRSQALRQIGEVRIAQGDLPAAMVAFEESEELARSLVESEPQQGTWRLGLGHSHFWMGNVHWLQGDLEAALEQFRRYGELTAELVAAEPGNAEWRLEDGYAATNLAAVYQRLGQEEEALVALRRSLEIKRRLVRDDPEDPELQRGLATGLSWYGSLLLDRGDLAEAAESFEQEEVLRREILEAEPDNTDARRLQAFNASHRGQLALNRGRLAASQRAFEEARDRFASLVRHDAQNAEWRRHLVVAEFHLCELALADDNSARARDALERGQASLSPLVEQDPTNQRVRREAARAELLSARLHLAEQRNGAALEHASAGRTAFANLVAASPANRQWRVDLAESLLVLGSAHDRLGNLDAARQDWQSSVEAAELLVQESGDLNALPILSQGLLLLDRPQEALPWVQRLVATGYARPEVLRRLRSLGADFPDMDSGPDPKSQRDAA